MWDWAGVEELFAVAGTIRLQDIYLSLTSSVYLCTAEHTAEGYSKKHHSFLYRNLFENSNCCNSPTGLLLLGANTKDPAQSVISSERLAKRGN